MRRKRAGSPPLSGCAVRASARYARLTTATVAPVGTPRISCGSKVAEALAHSTAVGWMLQHTAPAPSTCGGIHAPARAPSADSGRDGPGEQIRFFALHRARDDYGRQARNVDSQPKEQVESGRAVVCFQMHHGLGRPAGTRLSSGRGSQLVLSLRPLAAPCTLEPLRGGSRRPCLARGARGARVAPQTSNCSFRSLYSRKRVRASRRRRANAVTGVFVRRVNLFA